MCVCQLLPASQDVKLRDATEEDLPEMLEIYNHSILNSTATFELEPKTLEQRRSWFSSHGRKYPLIVAEVEHRKVVGYCCLSSFRQSCGYSPTVELSVYVHNEFRRRGIASTLVNEIISRARELQYHSIVSVIAGSNEASIELHKNLGFEFIGRLKQVGFKFSRWEDDVLYQLLLS